MRRTAEKLVQLLVCPLRIRDVGVHTRGGLAHPARPTAHACRSPTCLSSSAVPQTMATADAAAHANDADKDAADEGGDMLRRHSAPGRSAKLSGDRPGQGQQQLPQGGTTDHRPPSQSTVPEWRQ